MKKMYVLEQDDMHILESCLKEINHSLSVIEQNKNHEECINENLSIIKESTDKAFELIKS